MNNKLIEELYNKIDNQEKIIRELQEENKHLQDQLNQALKDYDKELQKNSKAIELLNNRSHSSDIITNMFNNLNTMDKVIEILKGEDK